jgi:hypothetical protein
MLRRTRRFVEKANLNGEELRRVASGASDPLASLLGQFADTTVSFEEVRLTEDFGSTFVYVPGTS